MARIVRGRSSQEDKGKKEKPRATEEIKFFVQTIIQLETGGISHHHANILDNCIKLLDKLTLPEDLIFDRFTVKEGLTSILRKTEDFITYNNTNFHNSLMKILNYIKENYDFREKDEIDAEKDETDGPITAL